MPLNFFSQCMFQQENRAFHRKERMKTFIENALLIQQPVLSFGNALENELYSMLKTYVFTLKNHVFNIVSHWRLQEHTLFTIECTCKTERKRT